MRNIKLVLYMNFIKDLIYAFKQILRQMSIKALCFFACIVYTYVYLYINQCYLSCLFVPKFIDVMKTMQGPIQLWNTKTTFKNIRCI